MENYNKKYLALGIPLGLESFFLILLNTINQILVSSLGKEVIAAVSIISQPRMLIYAIARSISYSLAILISKNLDDEENDIFESFLGLSFLFILGLILLMLLFLRPLLIFAGAQEDYLDLAYSYGSLNIIFILFYSLTTIIQAVLISKNHGNFILTSNVISNLLNIGLCYLMIYGKWGFRKMGIVGLGLGGIIASLINFLTSLVFVIYKRYLKISKIKIRPGKEKLKVFTKEFNGIFLEQISERLGMFLYSKYAAGLGTLEFAAHSIGMNICDMYWAFAQGMSRANMTVSSELIGKNLKNKLKKLFKFASKVNIIMSSLVLLALVFYGKNLVNLYTKDEDITYYVMLLLPYIALVSYPEGQAMIGSSSLRALGRAKTVAKIYFITTSIIRPILTLVLINILGYLGPILALVIDQCLKAFFTNYILVKK